MTESPQVFISSAYSDRDWIRRFVDQLQSAGQNVWYYEREVAVGEPWEESEDKIKQDFPKAYRYLVRKKKKLETRRQFKEWYGFSAPRNLDVHNAAHILVPLLANRGLYCYLPEEKKEFCLRTRWWRKWKNCCVPRRK